LKQTTRRLILMEGNDFRSNMIQTIRKCDALTVTNQALAENYARFTDKPIYVLPIYMDYDYYGDAIKTKLPKRNTDEVRIGWFGSKSHFEDLRMVLPAIKNVLDKYKNVKFVYVGYGHGSTNLGQMSVWGEEEVFQEIPRDRREFAEGVVEGYWPFRHRMLDFDIGICPLVDDEFNQAKVNTKWLEYSVFETPSVVSPTVYGESVKHGETGLIASTVEEWEESLTKLVENEELRKKIGKAAAKEVAEKWNMEDYWEKWVDVYSKTLK
jgi:O-antigen biosynthesis protein